MEDLQFTVPNTGKNKLISVATKFFIFWHEACGIQPARKFRCLMEANELL